MALRFSQRIGKTPVRDALQADGMDDRLRRRLWNCVRSTFLKSVQRKSLSYATRVSFYEDLWHQFFGRITDAIVLSTFNGVKALRNWFFKTAGWAEVYDLIEYLAAKPKEEARDSYGLIYRNEQDRLVLSCNQVLEEDMSGWRIISGQVMQITDEQEVAAIEAAVGQRGPWSTPAEQISKSAGLLFRRKTPDYPNAVKEAITAVESACCIVAGKNATLTQALKVIEKRHPLHPALKSAFGKLYKYTSDDGGIRHGSMDMADVNFEEAKYMLVACAAFVNYLKGISAL